jgi:hypothetical protein
MTNFLSAEFIWRFGGRTLKSVQSAEFRVRCSMPKFFGSAKSTALRKIAVSPFANRHSLLAAVLPFATRRSPFAAFLPVAIRHSLPFFSDLPICRPHDLPKTRLGRSLALPLNSVLRSALRQT